MTAKPWNMRPGETTKAYQAFEVYRGMGSGRTLDRACAMLGKSRGTVERWMIANEWTSRVRAFDEAAAEKAAGIALEDAATVRARQAQHAKAIQLRAMQKIAAMDPGDMSMGEATRAWQVGAEAERKALGIPEKVEVTGDDGGPLRIVFGYDDTAAGIDDGAGDGSNG